MATHPETLITGFVRQKEHVLREEARFPYMGYTCDLCSCSTSWWWFSRPTALMSYAPLIQAHACRVPIMVENI